MHFFHKIHKVAAVPDLQQCVEVLLEKGQRVEDMVPPELSVFPARPVVAMNMAAPCGNLAGATPRALAPALLGRSKPNSLSQGADNDIFIQCREQSRSFSRCLLT